jgi:PD-(D/E)XK endonuclease
VLTTDQKGVIAEQAIAFEAIRLGLGVYLPLGDERYDLILDLRPRLLRVQCEWAVFVNGVVQIRPRRCRRGREGLIHRTYEPGEIDVIAAYCDAVERCYLLPTELSVGRATVQLRVDPCLNNQRRRIHWARDFEFEATIKALQGPIAQLGERHDGIVEAAGSSPAGSTYFSPIHTR